MPDDADAALPPPLTELAHDLAEADLIADRDWQRAEAAGGLPFPRGKAWQTKDLPADAILIDQAGRAYRRNAAGELRRIKGLPSEGEDAK